MRITVKEEQKTYLLPFSIGSKYHINRDFISKEDINYVLFDDIDIQFKKVVDNPQDYINGLDSYVKNLLTTYSTDHIRTNEFLHAYFDIFKDSVLTFE